MVDYQQFFMIGIGIVMRKGFIFWFMDMDIEELGVGIDVGGYYDCLQCVGCYEYVLFLVFLEFEYVMFIVEWYLLCVYIFFVQSGYCVFGFQFGYKYFFFLGGFFFVVGVGVYDGDY